MLPPYYELIFQAMSKGDIVKLEEYSEIVESFPLGKDDFINRYWIINAIHCENLESINWVLSKEPNLNFIDSEGLTVLICTIDMDANFKYLLLRKFLKLGVPVDLEKSAIGFTALHHAACENDVEAFKILVEHGADIERYTIDENYSNVFMLAKNHKSNLILDWFEMNSKKKKA